MRLSRPRALQMAAAIIIGTPMVFGTTIGPNAGAIETRNPPMSNSSSPVFTLQALESGKLDPVDAETHSNGATTESLLRSGENGLNYMAVSHVSAQNAVLDASLLDEGILVASGKTFVDLSWRSNPEIREYLVYSGDDLINRTSSTAFRDSDVTSGTMKSYRIIPVPDGDKAAPVTSPDGHPQIIGIQAQVPDESRTMRSAANAFAGNVEAAASENGSTIQARTFIPEETIDAPATGCEYGSSYQFHGDNRSYSPYSSEYRTNLVANVRWDDEGGGPRLIGSTKRVGETVVYDESTGEEVDRETAPADRIEVSQLGADSSKVDLRFSIHSSNPFCDLGAISGAFTMNAYKSGSWIIRSGSHRQMPHWEIYITWLGGVPNTVYKKEYTSMYCLVNWACPDTPMGGAGETYDWQITGRLFSANDEGLAACQSAGRDGVENEHWSDYHCLQNDSMLSLLALDSNFEDAGLLFSSLTDCATEGAKGITDDSWVAFQCRSSGSFYRLWVVYT